MNKPFDLVPTLQGPALTLPSSIPSEYTNVITLKSAMTSVLLFQALEAAYNDVSHPLLNKFKFTDDNDEDLMIVGQQSIHNDEDRVCGFRIMSPYTGDTVSTFMPTEEELAALQSKFEEYATLTDMMYPQVVNAKLQVTPGQVIPDHMYKTITMSTHGFHTSGHLSIVQDNCEPVSLEIFNDMQAFKLEMTNGAHNFAIRNFIKSIVDFGLHREIFPTGSSVVLDRSGGVHLQTSFVFPEDLTPVPLRMLNETVMTASATGNYGTIRLVLTRNDAMNIALRLITL